MINGGVHQYFWNRGEDVAEVIAGYEMTGATHHATMLRDGIRVMLRERAIQRRLHRRGTLRAFVESRNVSALSALDDRFLALEENADILRTKYVRAHPEQFYRD